MVHSCQKLDVLAVCNAQILDHNFPDHRANKMHLPSSYLKQTLNFEVVHLANFDPALESSVRVQMYEMVSDYLP